MQTVILFLWLISMLYSTTVTWLKQAFQEKNEKEVEACVSAQEKDPAGGSTIEVMAEMLHWLQELHKVA